MASAVLILMCLAVDDDASARQLVYQGTFSADAGDEEPATKRFQLEIVTGRDGDATVWHWIMDEQGPGRWDWPHRFGRAVVLGDEAGDDVPSLYYERGDDAHVVPLELPHWSGPAELSADATWQDGDRTYRVTRPASGAPGQWNVAVDDRMGRRATLRVDPGRGLIVSARYRVFIGRGDQHTLALDLEGDKPLSAEEAVGWTGSFQALDATRKRTGFARGDSPVTWSADQLAAIALGLKSAVAPDSGRLAALYAAAAADHREQSHRAGILRSRGNRLVGQTLRPFKLNRTSGRAFSSSELAGHVTVLHFWEYRDVPLKEPYGQVGFLDFLHRQREKDGVVVLGIAVAARDADASRTDPVAASARRLAAFMNLGYPVLVDDGSLLEQIGDPRVAGAALPMVIVLDAKGAVTHYHVGLYPVEGNQGLRALDAEITRALDNRE